MHSVSEFIHEVFLVFIFAGAITFLVFLSNVGKDMGRSVDDSSRVKTNIVEGVSTVNEVDVSGASVYYDVQNMVRTVEAVKIVIKDSSGTERTIRPNYTADMIYREFTKNNISNTLKSWLVMDGTYVKTYADDYDTATRQAKMITTVKYTLK